MFHRKIQAYRNLTRLILRFLAGDKTLIGLYVVLSVFGALTEGVGAFLLVPLLETMGQSNIFASVPVLSSVSGLFELLPADTRLLWAGVVMLVVVLLRGVLMFATEVIGYGIPIRVDHRLRIKAHASMLVASMDFRDTLGAGEISNFTIGHPARVGIAMRFVAMLIANSLILICYILILTLVAPLLCLVAFVYVATTTLIFKKLSARLVQIAGQGLTQAHQTFNQLFYETVHGTRLIRISGAVEAMQDQIVQVVGQLGRARFVNVAVENMTFPFFSTVGGVLISILVMLVGTMKPEAAAPAVGLLVIFFVLLFRILSPLTLINIARTNIVIHIEALDQLDQLFAAAQRAMDPDGHVAFDALKSSVRFEGVTFAYRADAPDAVSNIDLVIPKGRVTAIVGTSGAGKSTLINLLTRLYRPTSGRILVDGQLLQDLVGQTWWRRLGVVTQDTILMNDTIRRNICFGLTDEIPDERVRAAAQMAEIDEWIESLPKKYRTNVGDGGTAMSGGQRQRLALARALLRNPDIVVLDEATSALDSLTERDIFDKLYDRVGQLTIVVIAHRLATVKRADQIVVMDKGHLVGAGTHQEVLLTCDLYRQLVESQLIGATDDAGDARNATAAGSRLG